MPEGLTHEQITERFLASKAVDYEAIGRFFAENGPELAVDPPGVYGTVIVPFIGPISCFAPWTDLAKFASSLSDFAQVLEAVDVQRRA